ncbi:glycosyltransferase family 8 protein [Algoriphagus mannitolivorans]|uniref:glycosyltransferase family 8 protein n=1 Tax=Algoriphagus mannitolivorans TaxID=226504 RepID=UPI00047DEC07|nr:glycosyltransferase family 8 protein [Algoriphagus mannitolivorans]
MKKFELPIVFCSDSNFTEHVAVTILSIVKSNPEFSFDFHLISSESNLSKLSKLERLSEDYNSNFQSHHPDFSVFDAFPKVHHLNLACYYRLLAPKLIQEKNYLYLDIDIIVSGDLSVFLKFLHSKFVLAAAADPVYRWEDDLGMSPESLYFNSGVMLVNREKWNSEKITERVMEYIASHPSTIRFGDQCALNAILDGKFEELPPALNQQAIIFRNDIPKMEKIWTREEIEEAINNPVVIHFTGPSKPWQYQCSHPEKGRYWDFQKWSPFKRNFPEGMKRLDYLKILIPNSFKKKLKEIFSRKK